MHLKTCMEKFGKEYLEVHKWLDFYAGKKGADESGRNYNYTGDNEGMHREQRHHVEGIEECVKIFGEYARKAAEQHVKDDFDNTIPKKNDYGPSFFTDFVHGEIKNEN